MTLFADDSTIIINCKDNDTYEFDINDALNTIISWLENNNLMVNLDKTKLMHFSQRISTGTNMNINFKGTRISETTISKFLGIFIDKSLTWKPHIHDLSKRLSKSAYALFKLSQVVNSETLLIAYHGLVGSILRYAIIFWGNSTDKNIKFKSQKRCLRSMFNLKTVDSCAPTVPSLYIMEVAMFVKTNPHLFQRAVDMSSRRQRDETRLGATQAKTALKHKSLFCMGPKIFNHIPKDIKQLNINLFKVRLNKLLAEKWYYSIHDFLIDRCF